MLSTLNSEQQAALTTLKMVQAKGTAKIQKLLESQSYGKVYNALSAFQDLPFSEKVFIDVAMLAPGIQNAHFFLIAIEASGKTDAIEGLKSALATHCWGKVADQINARLTDPTRQFSGSDLHYANAPTDTASCSMGALGDAIAAVVGAGASVAGFFNGTLPDFFTGQFSNFFTNDVSGFFTGDVKNFFVNIGDGFMQGAGDFANFFTDDVGGVFEDIGKGFESGFNDVKDWFGGLF